MPYRPQPMDQVWPPPGPIPRRLPDGRILARRLKLTEDGPTPAGYRYLAPGDPDYPAYDRPLKARGK